MSKFKCNHDWEVAEDYKRNSNMEFSCVLRCKKCAVYMSAHDAAEIELWKHTVGIQKWLSVGAFLIALASLVISIIN